MKSILHLPLLLSCLGMNLSANIQTYGFSCVTSNSPNCGVAVAPQLFVDLIGGTTTSAVVGTAPATTIGANQVLFRFRNIGPNPSSITDVYFDDGTLLAIASVVNGSSAVEFETGARPGNLPGGNAIDFNTSAGFSADSNAPVRPKGVNPGQELGILFDLQGTQTYLSVVNAMSLSLANPGVDVVGGLRVGIHVQGLRGGFSESLVNGACVGSCNDDVVPEPGFYGLLATGLVGLAFTAKKIRRRSAE